MASFAAACRLSARLASSKLPRDAVVRGFRTSTAALAAQNFTMPALSPTMTEGNIATWHVKEGDKYAAGDVLLEIETDKATMDVEAQEDGVMMKIMQGNGSKGVAVGSRIAVIAEEGDDISSLEIPADESPKQQDAKQPTTPQPEATTAKETQAKSPAPAPVSGAETAGRAHKQTYPPFPSVAQLLHENGIDKSKINEIPATGPKGRLLKGDVLAYLGKAKANAAASVQDRFEKLSHLDLSNIKVAEKKAAPKKAEAAPARPAPPEELLVTLPVSLESVIETQKMVKNTLNVSIPLSAFISQATEVANHELPLPANAKPSADELFNQILGLDKVGPKGSKGHYLPQISALPPPPAFSQKAFPGQPDIIDVLAGTAKVAKPVKPRPHVSGLSTGVNVFSLKVPKAEEKRAKSFLAKIKLVLENEPGKLVL